MLQTIEHLFDVSPERLWQVYFFDRDHERGLCERLRLRVVDRELQYEGVGPTLFIRRRMRLLPERAPPALFGRLLGAGRVVTETGDFSAAHRRYSLEFALPLLAGKVRCDGEYTWDTLPSGGTRRVWRGRCEARVPLVGPALERYLLAEIEASLEDSYAFTRRWLRDHPDAPADPDVR
jgi:hypothetical protein